MTFFACDFRFSPSPFCFVWILCTTIASFLSTLTLCLAHFDLFAIWILTPASLTILILAQPL